jgi:hypothetical protein
VEVEETMKLLLALLVSVLSVVMAAFGQVSAEATSVPAPRYVHQMMTYDEGNRCVLLFGGSGQSNSYGDLWAFDRRGWRRLSDTGPAPRDAGVLVYDTRRKRTVLYGGRDRTGALRDTWEWDGTRWHAVARHGPAPGIHAAAAFDRTRGVVVLFVPLLTVGPSTQPLQAETWTWDGKQWTKADASAPAGYMPMGMVFDAIKGTIVTLVGKFDFSASAMGNGTTELWEWTGKHWRCHPVLPPAIKEPFQSNIAFAGPRDGLLLFDGSTQATWRWDQKHWTQVSKTGPTERNVHVMAYDGARRRVVLFGGSKQRERLGDTWEWDGKQWQQWRATITERGNKP